MRSRTNSVQIILASILSLLLVLMLVLLGYKFLSNNQVADEPNEPVTQNPDSDTENPVTEDLVNEDEPVVVNEAKRAKILANGDLLITSGIGRISTGDKVSIKEVDYGTTN